MKISLFKTAKDTAPSSSLVFDQYLENIKDGYWQDMVLPIRVLSEKYKKGEIQKDEYQRAKLKVEAVTASGVFSYRKASNLVEHSGFISIDIDTDDNPDGISKDTIAADPYTYALHHSIGGAGLVVYIKINPKRHLDSFLALEKHFANEHKVVIDKSCKDISRLRYVSFDPDLYKNPKAKIFKSYLPKKEAAARKDKTVYVCGKNDVEHVINELGKIGANIAESYDDWLRLSFAFASEFGEGGRQYFHDISKSSAKYDPQKCDKKYNQALNAKSRTNINTFFYLAKQAGVRTTKTQESALVETIAKKNHSLVGKTGYFKDAVQAKETTLREIQDKAIEIDLQDAERIAAAVAKMDIKEVKETQLTGDTFEDSILFIKSLGLKFNTITRCIEHEGKEINDLDYNSFYLQAKRLIGKGVTKSDIVNIIESNIVEPYNPFEDFLNSLTGEKEVGHIQQLLSCFELEKSANKDYKQKIEYFITKWLVSVIASMRGTYSIMCLVLCGAQGRGKTEFFRGLLPKELQKYYAESKLDEGKDDYVLMTKKLLILDDEFGGKSKQDAKKFKDLISKQTFTLRRPYGRVSEDLPRFAVLCGTSNEDEVINDPTGNRRIIPVNITSFNLERFKSIDKRALWAEVLDFYNEVGNDWMLSKDDINDLGRIAATNKQASQEEEAFLQFFGIPEEGDYCDYKTNTEIKTTIELNTRLKISHVKLAAVLKALGVKKQVKKLNGVAQTVYAVTSLQP